MKKFFPLAVLALLCLVLSGCGSSKKIVYLQNADSLNYAASRMLYSAKIMPKDLLTITVSTSQEDAAQPFNIKTPGVSTQNSMQGNGSTFLVDNDGTISYPLIGRIKIAGMTCRECEDHIKSKIATYLSASENPVVIVRMAGFKYAVSGEVNSPGVYSVENEKISVLEALAKAGDLTMYGKRKNVLLLREDANGEKSVHRLDLTDANLINSPYYYLQQNDYLYVQPNKTKVANNAYSTGTTIWFSVLGVMSSLAALVVTLLKD